MTLAHPQAGNNPKVFVLEIEGNNHRGLVLEIVVCLTISAGAFAHCHFGYAKHVCHTCLIEPVELCRDGMYTVQVRAVDTTN